MARLGSDPVPPAKHKLMVKPSAERGQLLVTCTGCNMFDKAPVLSADQFMATQEFHQLEVARMSYLDDWTSDELRIGEAQKGGSHLWLIYGPACPVFEPMLGGYSGSVDIDVCCRCELGRELHPSPLQELSATVTG